MMLFKKDTGFDPWESPVSYTARSMAKLVRESMDELGWKYERETSERTYDRIVVVIPMFKFAHVHRFVVSDPVEIIIDTYDTRPTHSSHMPYLTIQGMKKKHIPIVRHMLEGVVERVERPPWEFTLAQRVNHGMLMSEFKKSRKYWSLFGFDSFKKWKPAKNGTKEKEKNDGGESEAEDGSEGKINDMDKKGDNAIIGEKKGGETKGT